MKVHIEKKITLRMVNNLRNGNLIFILSSTIGWQKEFQYRFQQVESRYIIAKEKSIRKISCFFILLG